MRRPGGWRAFAAALLATAAATLAGCASDRVHDQGLALIEQGQDEAGLRKLEEAMTANPSNHRYRADYLTKRDQTIARTLVAGDRERAAGRPGVAEGHYQHVLRIDQNNARAAAGLAALARDRHHQEQVEQARALADKGDMDAADSMVRSVLAEDPRFAEARALQRRIEEYYLQEALAVPTLRSKYSAPVTIEFRDAQLKLVFEALSRTTGINFILDRDVRQDTKTTINVRQVGVEDAIDLILLPNQLEKKVLTENAVLIYPSTPQKIHDYQELVVKSFYLESTDVKQTVNMLKTVLKVKDMFIDEKINLLVMRDTPDTIRLAEKLVAAQDLADPEVLLEMEVIEVSRTRLLELGVKWPEQMTFSALDPTGGDFVLNDLRKLNADTIAVSPPSVTINARKAVGTTNTLASPRVRVRNREKARVMIGDRVPVISSIVTPSTGTPVVTEQVQYLDVGLKLEVEPDVHLDEKVSINVSLEVSTLGEKTSTRNGTIAYRIGTRNAHTILRSRDGETQVLMGLIRDDDRKTTNGVPGLGDLPVLGHLFSNRLNESEKTEIILTITPRVVYNVQRPGARTAEFGSGTESGLRARPRYVRQMPSPQPAEKITLAAVAAAAAAPAVGAAQPVSFSWQGPAQAKVGETFGIVVRAKADQPLSAAALQMGIDPSVLEIVQVSEGSFLKQDGGGTAFTQRIDTTGMVTVRTVRTAPNGIGGEADLLTITLKAKQPVAQTQIRLLGATPLAPGNLPIPVAPSQPHSISLQP